jgi:hypothetical protein
VDFAESNCRHQTRAEESIVDGRVLDSFRVSVPIQIEDVIRGKMKGERL